MPIYAGRSYTSTQIGAKLAEVSCEKCQTRYFYELARIGTGSEEAPFFLGGKRAAESAVKQAQADVDRRLDREAELVPCPKCHWINDELVRGYRRTRFQEFTYLAFLLGFFGTVISLLCGFFSGLQNVVPMNAAEWSFWFIKGPAWSLGGAALLLGIQWVLRQLLQPNSRFPDPPRLPAGTPPALTLDPSTGEYQIANPSMSSDDDADPRVTIQAGRFSLPETCCSCLKPTRSTYVATGIAEQIEVNLCGSCERSLLWKLWVRGIAFVVASVCVGMSLLWVIKLNQDTFGILSAGLLIVAALAAKFVANYRVAPATTRTLDVARGVYQIHFRNVAYAKLCRDTQRQQEGSRSTLDQANPTHD